jgi:hypothetical protein
MTSLGFIEVATLLCHSVVEVLKRDVQIPTNFSKQFFKFKFSGNAQLAFSIEPLNFWSEDLSEVLELSKCSKEF